MLVKLLIQLLSVDGRTACRSSGNGSNDFSIESRSSNSGSDVNGGGCVIATLVAGAVKEAASVANEKRGETAN